MQGKHHAGKTSHLNKPSTPFRMISIIYRIFINEHWQDAEMHTFSMTVSTEHPRFSSHETGDYDLLADEEIDEAK